MVWDVAVTWPGLLWARDSSALTISHQVGLSAAFRRAFGEWSSLTPAVRWAELLHQGGLARPLTNAATLVRCAMGEGAVAMAGRPPI